MKKINITMLEAQILKLYIDNQQILTGHILVWANLINKMLRHGE